MTADSKEESKCSEKNIDLKTVECLRGRLLAERQASRAANEDADQLSEKVVKLENLIKEETKLRDRAEKKLKILTKKVQSLKISHITEESEQDSRTSDNCSSSCRSTVTSFSGTREQDQKLNRILDYNAVDNSSNQSQDCSTEQNSSSPVGEDSSFGGSSQIDSQSASSLKDSKMEINMSQGCERDEDCVNTSLALVPISPPATSDDQPKMVNIDANVSEVLDNLRQLREKLQSSLEKRMPMIDVCPT